MKRPGRKLEIEKVLVVSTSHVPFSFVKSDLMADFATMSNEYGWLLPSSSELGGIQTNEARALRRLLAFAHKNGCRYVHFDCDAETISGFPVFDW